VSTRRRVLLMDLDGFFRVPVSPVVNSITTPFRLAWKEENRDGNG
jgi:hypothetical protein